MPARNERTGIIGEIESERGHLLAAVVLLGVAALGGVLFLAAARAVMGGAR